MSVQNNSQALRTKLTIASPAVIMGDGRVLSKTRSIMQNLNFIIVKNKKVSGHPSFD